MFEIPGSNPSVVGLRTALPSKPTKVFKTSVSKLNKAVGQRGRSSDAILPVRGVPRATHAASARDFHAMGATLGITSTQPMNAMALAIPATTNADT
jgi:hypothetical protein